MAGDQANAKRSPEENDADVDKRPDKRLRYDYDDTILVLVDVEKTKFTVHKDVICARSQFFKAACKEHWEEGQQKVVPLPDTETETFQMYMDLMYNRLSYDNEWSRSSAPLIKFHVLGDFLGAVKARNKAMELLLSRPQKKTPSTMSVDFIWSNTAPGSLLRKWAVDSIAARLGPPHFARYITSFPAGFVQEIAIRLQDQAYPQLPDPLVNLQDYMEAVAGGDE